jgi:uncharacterized membrane protein YfcA
VAVLIGLAAVVTSALTAVLGFGGGIVLLALLLLFVDPLVAIPLHAAIQVVSNGTRTVIRRRDVDWSIVARFSLLALPAGALVIPLVTRAPQAAIQLAIGVTVLVATWLPERTGRALPRPTTPVWVGSGAVIGGLNVAVGATGPLQAPLFRAGTTDRLGFVGTFAASQTIGHLMKIVLFGLAGFAPTRYALPAVFGIAGVIAGTHLGSRALDRMPEQRFTRLYLAAITAVSLYVMIDAVVGF